MNWTNTLPTVPGYYWRVTKTQHADYKSVVQVHVEGGSVYDPSTGENHTQGVNVYWLGPIHEPNTTYLTYHV